MKTLLRHMILCSLVSAALPAPAWLENPVRSEALGAIGRLRPPAAVTCDRNELTAYHGKVVGYLREPSRTRVTIHTDWDTDESVELHHAGSDDPSHQFLLSGRPFTASDWQRIESAPGILIVGMRATAWVCGDGENLTLIDWQPSN